MHNIAVLSKPYVIQYAVLILFVMVKVVLGCADDVGIAAVGQPGTEPWDWLGFFS